MSTSNFDPAFPCESARPEHSPGRLTYQEDSDAYTHLLRDERNRIVATAQQSSLPVNEADARRLAACWNAFIGIPTASLEALAERTGATGSRSLDESDAANLVGLIQRNEQTPAHIVAICHECGDKHGGVLRKFAAGQAVKPSALGNAASLRRGLSSDSQQNEDLKALQVWAIRQESLIAAMQGLQEAAALFRDAVRRNQLDPVQAARLWAAATEVA